ncbi:MAG: hypothetical protein IH880_00810 [Candidatus Marinimicrobia bacterium]|nr:hypothetical protein [Candidatus Neomarinimicrobiota bacterium]
MKKLKKKDLNNLYEAVVSLKTVEECKDFLRDLLTKTEIDEAAMRWKVARLLNDGKTYIEIEKITGLSSTTVARVHKWLKKGKGGYSKMLRNISQTTINKRL